MLWMEMVKAIWGLWSIIILSFCPAASHQRNEMLAYVEVDCPGKLRDANELLCQLLSNFLVCPSNFLPVNPKVMGMPPGQQFQN
jgi:hypothetical protein